jgi:hypothetical protein
MHLRFTTLRLRSGQVYDLRFYDWLVHHCNVLHEQLMHEQVAWKGEAQ